MMAYQIIGIQEYFNRRLKSNESELERKKGKSKSSSQMRIWSAAL